MSNNRKSGAEPGEGEAALPLGLLLSQISSRRAFEKASSADEVVRSAQALASAVASTEPDDVVHEVVLSPGLIRLVGGGLEGRSGGGSRGVITGFSASSRRRMLSTLGTLDLASIAGIPVFVTLTYPGDWRQWCPTGREAKRQLDMFRRRWERKWGSFHGVWKLEFQPRHSQPSERQLAPHFHILAVIPSINPGISPPTITAMSDLRDWVSETWWQVVGSKVEAHRLAGTQVKESDGDYPGRVIGYFAGYTAGRKKEEQHIAPSNWPELGRFWGVIGFERVKVSIEVGEHDFYVLRRLLAELMARRRGSRRRSLSRPDCGLWFALDNAPQLAARLAAWLAGEYPPRLLP